MNQESAMTATIHHDPEPPKASWFRAALLVIAVLLAANLTLVVGRHTGRWDASDFFCPYFILVADHARHGELLTWTPLVEGGCPAGFDPEIGALSPATVGLAALLGPSEPAFRVYWLTIWGLGGLGMLLLARHLRAALAGMYGRHRIYVFRGLRQPSGVHGLFGRHGPAALDDLAARCGLARPPLAAGCRGRRALGTGRAVRLSGARHHWQLLFSRPGLWDERGAHGAVPWRGKFSSLPSSPP